MWTVINDYIYKIDNKVSDTRAQQITWKPDEGEYRLINIAVRDTILYVEMYDKQKNEIVILSEVDESAKTLQFEYDGEHCSISEEELILIKDIIYNGDLCCSFINDNIWEVISEEVDLYFAGAKSAEETEEIIQSRIQIILNE